jgi:polyphosphate kinase 2 (PPK2 family)
VPSRERWYEYSRARDLMLEATDTEFAPWHIGVAAARLQKFTLSQHRNCSLE